MMHPSTRTKIALPNMRGTTYSYNDEETPSSSSASGENSSRQIKRYEPKEFDDNDYGFLSIADDTFENFLKNDKFEDEEEDLDYDVLTQLSNPLENLRIEGNPLTKFCSSYEDLTKYWTVHAKVKEESSDTGLHRQNKDETRCIKKSFGNKLSLRSPGISNDAVAYGQPRRSNYNNRKSF